VVDVLLAAGAEVNQQTKAGDRLVKLYLVEQKGKKMI
jgi:hypothetical protein